MYSWTKYNHSKIEENKYENWKKAGYFKNKGQWHTTPKVGDIIFFKSGSRVSHVGLYYKDGKMIHAANPSTGVIVSNIAGTTRDAIDTMVTKKGKNYNFIDTAGIRNPTDEVEAIGIKKSESYIEKADLILFVVDGSSKITEYDKKILELVKDKKHIDMHKMIIKNVSDNIE